MRPGTVRPSPPGRPLKIEVIGIKTYTPATEKNQLAKLINAADLTKGEVVLEVGPGTGTLTEALLETGAEVIACEVDTGIPTIENRCTPNAADAWAASAPA